MAKKNTILFRMVSTSGSGYFFVRKKNPKKLTKKIELRKYDPVVRKHVIFKEARIK